LIDAIGRAKRYNADRSILIQILILFENPIFVFSPTMAATDRHPRKKTYLLYPYQLKTLIGMVTSDNKQGAK
jgi:hypothetical protein